jgi:hypothetical protein
MPDPGPSACIGVHLWLIFLAWFVPHCSAEGTRGAMTAAPPSGLAIMHLTNTLNRVPQQEHTPRNKLGQNNPALPASQPIAP